MRVVIAVAWVLSVVAALGSCTRSRPVVERHGTAVSSAAGIVLGGPPQPVSLRAVGRVAECVATAIGPRKVLTARHCQVNTTDTFCLAAGPGETGSCFSIAEVAPSPTADLAVLTLIDALPEVRGAAWSAVEARGERARRIERWGVRLDAAGVPRASSATARVTRVTSAYLGAVTEAADAGCYGDSGAPLVALSESGIPSIVGVLHAGDPECRGYDEYVRTDIARSWIEAQQRPQGHPAPGAP